MQEDLDQPTARVYLSSYNFSKPADVQNGENLVLIRNPRVATSYAVEALRLFDHYHFRSKEEKAVGGGGPLALARPPRTPDEKPWWDDDYTNPVKIKDRLMFA